VVHAPDRAPAIINESKTNRMKFSGEYAVTLKPGNTVGGIVKDAAGKGIAGAQSRDLQNQQNQCAPLRACRLRCGDFPARTESGRAKACRTI